MRVPRLLIILGALMAWMGRGVAAQQMGEGEEFVLRGRVVNAVTGEPVGGALVELQADRRRAQFSTAEGVFEFGELSRGNYVVFARKPGYFNERDLGGEPTGIEGAHPVPSDQEVVLKLTPEGIIAGRIEDEKGRPLEGVNVQAEMWMVSNGTRRLQPAPGGAVQTDDEGSFRIAELFPGEYYLKFSEPGGGGMIFRDPPQRGRARGNASANEGKKGYGTQYYPGAVDEAMASVIHVKAGAEVPIQQVLEPLRLYQVSGLVRGAPNGEGFSVMLMTAGSEGEVRGKAQIFPSSGEFRIEGVPAGRYLLTASAQDPAAERFNRRSSQLVGQAVIDVNTDIAGLTLLLGHGATIPVRVGAETARIGENGQRVRVELQSTEFPQAMQQVVLPPWDVRGPREFTNVAPGTYSVEAMADGGEYIASIRCAGVDLLKEDLKVGAGTSVSAVEVAVRNDGAELIVSAVENGKPVAGRVVVYSEEYPKRSMVIMTWPANVAALPNLAPGTYRLIATRGLRELEFRNPAAMAKYLTRAQTVTLAPEARVNVQVEVQEVGEP